MLREGFGNFPPVAGGDGGKGPGRGLQEVGYGADPILKGHGAAVIERGAVFVFIQRWEKGFVDFVNFTLNGGITPFEHSGVFPKVDEGEFGW